jgi:hypothetical protein
MGALIRRQQGVSIVMLIVVLSLLALVAILGMKVVPAYIEFNSVRKIIQAMKREGDTRKSVREIRDAFNRRASVDYVDSIKGDDLEITKEGGEVIVAAIYSKKVPIIANFNACLDFVASSKDPI